MSENSEAKPFWTNAHAGTSAHAHESIDIHNTATGVIVSSGALALGGTIASSTIFIPGEHWDAEAGKFRSLTKGVTP